MSPFKPEEFRRASLAIEGSLLFQAYHGTSAVVVADQYVEKISKHIVEADVYCCKHSITLVLASAFHNCEGMCLASCGRQGSTTDPP